ncbi:UDP-N-acetylmuramate--L-alanine ligase [candidate division CSSED10-310 bacterium]|uniref:UDP-N-acetylmuramate--L-alanine ligase n=1 Tax=candidate division CSSED10-310 bacterium TaxID=2855610 RepID=A0ABV6YT52_UNCC1
MDQLNNRERIHFIGVAGSGMSPLARFLVAKSQYLISGSDRIFDRGQGEKLRSALLAAGVLIVPQDGRSLNKNVTKVIVSGAIEKTVPEMQATIKFDIPISTRAQLLASVTNKTHGIAIAGTSGKTTVTGMCGAVFSYAGLNPSVICGGVLKDFYPTNLSDSVVVGDSDYIIFEADESDGSLIEYAPQTGMLLNISKDHQPLELLHDIFTRYMTQCQRNLIYNNDDRNIRLNLARINNSCSKLSFGWSNSAHIYPRHHELLPWGSRFQVGDVTFTLQLPGRHNISNALAAIALGSAYDIPFKSMSQALNEYKGIARRLDLIGSISGIRVIDDFAHNPDKIAATLTTLQSSSSRTIAIFQPHGFGPTRFLKDDLIECFTTHLRANDVLLLPEIYYAGGTVARDISSLDLVQAISAARKFAYFFPDRAAVIPWLKEHVKLNDTIVVMGARDDTLTDFARTIYHQLRQQYQQL